ncbi:m-phase inducer phosphatase 1-B [Nephila pilipes]|uniref:protein-tyrosine-phosphatase n=1 Tax=Nephila pilipes TaxID=299642 RepID=A0A8X6QTG1_NEPPI|nr:m-phase inducer phosphatase 1-B [Nephila pilipes]
MHPVINLWKGNMDKRKKNKENLLPENNMKITDCFKVKKCLFHSSQPELASPTNEVFLAPNSDTDSPNDSPFALFKIRKRSTLKPEYLKSLNSSNKSADETPQKRSHNVTQMNYSNDVIMESPVSSHSLSLAKKNEEDTIEIKLNNDFSQNCILPVINGKHPDLNSISAETVAFLIKTHESHNFSIIDCRFPYEFRGGHIMDAVNLFHRSDVEEYFFKSAITASQRAENKLLIFYCEFSSERAPNMMRFIRNLDRSMNEGSYPYVYYPHLYLIEGGYKSFFADYKHLCEPQQYKAMLDKDSTEQLAHYRSICKTWSMKLKKGKRYLMADSNSQRTLFSPVA